MRRFRLRPAPACPTALDNLPPPCQGGAARYETRGIEVPGPSREPLIGGRAAPRSAVRRTPRRARGRQAGARLPAKLTRCRRQCSNFVCRALLSPPLTGYERCSSLPSSLPCKSLKTLVVEPWPCPFQDALEGLYLEACGRASTSLEARFEMGLLFETPIYQDGMYPFEVAVVRHKWLISKKPLFIHLKWLFPHFVLFAGRMVLFTNRPAYAETAICA